MNRIYSQAQDQHKKNIIMCIGIGGGGSNVVNYIHSQHIKGVSLMVMNTDQQALQGSPVPNKLQLGPNATNGLGAGANPKVGEQAALESEREIEELFTKEIKMVFVTAGMGGGTGTGAAPIVAGIAKKKGALVIGVVTYPFLFEGKQKQAIAEEGLKNLQQYCDTIIVIENQYLMDSNISTKNYSLSAAFRMVDEVLYQAITSITEPINKPGIINVDFHDVHTMLHGAGNAVMGTGTAEGEDRSKKAIKQAINCPLLRDQNIQEASRLLLSITSGKEDEITLKELAEMTTTLQEILNRNDIMVIWGHAYEEDLGKKVRVSVVASGFAEKKPAHLVGETHIKHNYQRRGAAAMPPTRTASYQLHSVSYKRPDNTSNTKVQEPTLQEKMQTWAEEAEHRVSDKDSLGDSDITLTDKEIKEQHETPAYMRKRKSLEYFPLHSESPTQHCLVQQEEVAQ